MHRRESRGRLTEKQPLAAAGLRSSGRQHGEKIRLRENRRGRHRGRGRSPEGVTKKRGEKQIRKKQTKALWGKRLKEVREGRNVGVSGRRGRQMESL